MVALFDFCSVSFAQNPKSVILTVPVDDKRTLSDLISRCMMFFECKCSNPLHVYT
jgi:hypothetical protein